MVSLTTALRHYDRFIVSSHGHDLFECRKEGNGKYVLYDVYDGHIIGVVERDYEICYHVIEEGDNLTCILEGYSGLWCGKKRRCSLGLIRYNCLTDAILSYCPECKSDEVFAYRV
jgi:hypothetical protein